MRRFTLHQWFKARSQRKSRRSIRHPARHRALGEMLEQRLLLAASFRVADASAFEDTSALVFSVFRETDTAHEAFVDYLIADVTARAGTTEDYSPNSGTLYFPADSTLQGVTVTLAADRRTEADEFLLIKLLNPQGGVIGDDEAIGTIRDDDAIIVTGPGDSTSDPPLVKVFDARTGAMEYDFKPFPFFVGGIRVASGDVDGDDVPDIIVGAGTGGGPHIKVFSGKYSSQMNGVLINEFFAYHPDFVGGVFVGAGDVNGDGRADIITGAGASGGPHVKVVSGLDYALLHDFFAFDASATGGVEVAVGNLTGDSRAEIIVGRGHQDGSQSQVRVFSQDALWPTQIRDFPLCQYS